MQKEIQKLIDTILAKSKKSTFSFDDSDEKISAWYVIAELRRILLYSNTKVKIIEIEEESELQKKYNNLMKDYSELQKSYIELQRKEIQRLK